MRLLNDLAALGGLASIGVGLWWVSPAAALIVVGSIVLTVALTIAWTKR